MVLSFILLLFEQWMGRRGGASWKGDFQLGVFREWFVWLGDDDLGCVATATAAVGGIVGKVSVVIVGRMMDGDGSRQ